jgi:DNA-binding CsgD family transcriptional regulator/cell pole-organizing protein PopZ
VPGIDMARRENGQSFLVGRTAERAILARLAGEAAAGQACTVLVEGVAGIGKSALLRYAGPSPDDFCILCARCDESEASLPFGAISQILCHVNGTAERIGFLCNSSAPQLTPTQVGADLLQMLCAAQEVQPVALIIDDLQWVDDASAEAIAFVLRRLHAGKVLVGLTARTEAGPADDWSAGRSGIWRRLVDGSAPGQRIRLRGLAVADVAEMAKRAGLGQIPLALADQLRRHTDGIPGYLCELLADLPRDHCDSLDGPLPVPSAAAAGVARMTATLPEPSVCMAEALAVLDTRCALGTAGQVAGVADPVTAFEPLLASGLACWWPEEPVTTVGLRVPVERDALYRLLTPGRRRELHLAAAAVVRGDAAWPHRVAAASGPDPELADELATAATARSSDGAYEAAAGLLLWAAGLSHAQHDYERDLLAGVALLIWCRSLSRAAALRDSVAACSPSPLRDLILVALEPEENKEAALEAMLSDVLAESAKVPGLGQAAAHVILALACGHEHSDADDAVIAERVLAIEELDAASAQLARCVAAEATGRLAGTSRARLREIERLGPHPSMAASAPADAILLWRRGICRAHTGQLATAAQDLSAALRSTSKDAFADAAITLGYVQYLLGQWDAAGSTAERAAAIALSRGAASTYAEACAVAACVAAGRGEWAHAHVLLRGASRWQLSPGTASPPVFTALAMAAMAQARGDHAAVLGALDRVRAACERDQYQLWWRPLQIEALIAKGQLDEASAGLVVLRAAADGASCLVSGIGWLSGSLVLRQGDAATARVIFEEALTIPATPDDIPLLRARLEHSYGQLLLAQKNRRLAATWIDNAHHRFAMLGAQSYLQRCEAVPAACGLRAGDSGAIKTRSILSAQEYRVAHLVAQGLTNQEVAQELYVRIKTVEYHLSNIFIKLDITSRRQLRALITGDEAGPEAALGVERLAVVQGRPHA